MRIMLDVDEGKDAAGKKAIRIRTSYYHNSKDCLRVRNCGVEIYNLIVESFTNNFVGGVIIHLGERT